MSLLLLLFLDYRPQILAVPPFEHTLGFYRASKYYLRLLLPGFNYNDPQGIAAVKLRELDNPKTKRDDDELTVFAVNSGNGQIIYNIGLTAVRVYGDNKTFANPKGIAVNEDGLIGLADYDNRRVVKLRYQNGELSWVSEIVLPGRPYDLCFDSKNNLYITDYDNSKIYVYGPDNSLLLSFGKEGRAYGEIYQVRGIEVLDADAPYNRYKEDFIVVVDNEGKRISKFSTGGRFLAAVQYFELGLAEANFCYVAVDYFGNIYVTDETNDQIHKFDHNLNYIISAGRTGTGQGEFHSPRGIAIWRRYGQVFITEKEGGQYLWISIDGFFVGSFPPVFTYKQPGTTLAIYTTDEARIDITIHNSLGDKVRDLIQKVKRPAGEFLVVWDGLDNEGNLVPAGDYEFRIQLKGLHGHGVKLKKLIKGSVKCVES